MIFLVGKPCSKTMHASSLSVGDGHVDPVLLGSDAHYFLIPDSLGPHGKNHKIWLLILPRDQKLTKKTILTPSSSPRPQAQSWSWSCQIFQMAWCAIALSDVAHNSLTCLRWLEKCSATLFSAITFQIKLSYHKFKSERRWWLYGDVWEWAWSWARSRSTFFKFKCVFVCLYSAIQFVCTCALAWSLFGALSDWGEWHANLSPASVGWRSDMPHFSV